MDKPMHHLYLFMQSALVRVRLNGFPLLEYNGRNPVGLAPPLNELLVGEENELEIDFLPTILNDGRISTVREAFVEGAIKAYTEDDIVAPETGEIVHEFRWVDLLNEQSLKVLPFTAKMKFGAEGPSFRSRLLQSEIIDDEEALIDYLIHFLSVFKRRDFAALRIEMEPKIQDLAAAYYESVEERLVSDRSFFEEMFWPAGILSDFEIKDIMLEKCCGGRIWKASIKPGRPFLQSLPDAEGTYYTLDVYIGKVDNRFCVVR